MRHLKLFILSLYIVSIQCRASLRNYVFIRNSSKLVRESNYFIYNSNRNSIVCRLQSLNSLTTNLLLYPSNVRVGFIDNPYSPLRKFNKCFFNEYRLYFVSVVSSYDMNIYNLQSNEWIRGSIYQNRYEYTINYADKSYFMRNRVSPLITEIYQGNSLISRFSMNSLSLLNENPKYNIEIYSDILPDPVHIFALYIFDSLKSKKRFPYYFPFG